MVIVDISSYKIQDLNSMPTPEHFYCPITRMIMRCPMLAADNIIYEQEAIEAWFSNHDTSFVLRTPLANQSLLPELKLSSEITSYLMIHSSDIPHDDVYLPEKWMANLLQAVRQNDLKEMKYLTQLDYRLLLSYGLDGYTAFHMACEASSFEILLDICHYLGSANLMKIAFPTPKNWVPRHLDALFMHVFLKEDVTLVSMILCMGVDANLPFSCGHFPLHWAISAENYALVNLLLDYNAHLNTGDEQGNQPLHLAAKKGNISIVSLLLSYGAALEARNLSELTPYDIAQKQGDFLLANKLQLPTSKSQAKTSESFAEQPNTSSLSGLSASVQMPDNQQVACSMATLSSNKMVTTTSIQPEKRIIHFPPLALASAGKDTAYQKVRWYTSLFMPVLDSAIEGEARGKSSALKTQSKETEETILKIAKQLD